MPAQELLVKITDFSPEFVKLMKAAGQSGAVLNHTRNALSFIAQAYQKTWRSYAAGEMTVPGARIIRSTGPYTRSIQIDDSKPFEKTIYTDYGPHEYIEKGHGPIDLKPGLLRGKSARHGKHGPYNIVSFKHQTPAGDRNPMPVSIFRLMISKTRAADQEKKRGLATQGGISEQVTSGPRSENRSYKWGARLDDRSQRGRRSKLDTGYTWKTGKYEGMVRMQQSTTKAKRTGYITFRVVSTKSDPRSWIVPAADPIPIRQATIDFVAQAFNVEDVLRQAMESDIK